MILTASISTASWALICMIISLILLFIAAFVTGGASSPSPTSWHSRVSFGWAGMLFFVLSVALG
jgi:purine-cytosine permease-like protein